MDIIQTVLDLFKNPIFSGVVGGGFVASMMFALKNTPVQLWNMFRRWMTVTLTVKGSHAFYVVLNNWLATTNLAEKATRLNLTSDANIWGGAKLSKKHRDFTLGFGTHLLWYNGTPVWVSRSQTDSKGQRSNATMFEDEIITMTTIGRSKTAIRSLVDSAMADELKEDRVPVSFFENGYYRSAVSRPKRKLSSIFIPEAQKNRIIRDIERFYNREAVYNERGTPWRRGILLRGEPGTGKTSLIFALASHFDKPVKMINLANVGGDTALMSAIQDAGNDCFIVMEDIDSVAVTHDRNNVKDKAELKDEQDKGTLTLAGILNAIDGIASPEGRVLFMTSNHAGLLDSALIRPGRIDLNETIDLLDASLAKDMISTFHPTKVEEVFELVKPQLPISAASLQNILLMYDEKSSIWDK